MKKAKKIIGETTDNRVYKSAVKAFREASGIIYCSRCPYHGGENLRKSSRRVQKSWKVRSKRKSQWREKK